MRFGCANQQLTRRARPRGSEALGQVHVACLRDLSERAEGYTLDLDSFSLLHEEGQQKGERVEGPPLGSQALPPPHRRGPGRGALRRALLATGWATPPASRAPTTSRARPLARAAQVCIAFMRADSGFLNQATYCRIATSRHPSRHDSRLAHAVLGFVSPR